VHFRIGSQLTQPPDDAAESVPHVLPLVRGSAELASAQALLAAADQRMRVAG
jgi:hypothetical protein